MECLFLSKAGPKKWVFVRSDGTYSMRKETSGWWRITLISVRFVKRPLFGPTLDKNKHSSTRRKSWIFSACRPLAAGDVGLETGYPEKICEHDARTITPPSNRGCSIFVLVLFIDFEPMKFFRDSRKRFSTNCLFFKMISRDSQTSSFKSYTFLRRIQNENQLDVGIQCFVAWV